MISECSHFTNHSIEGEWSSHLHILPAFGWWLVLILCPECKSTKRFGFFFKGGVVTSWTGFLCTAFKSSCMSETKKKNPSILFCKASASHAHMHTRTAIHSQSLINTMQNQNNWSVVGVAESCLSTLWWLRRTAGLSLASVGSDPQPEDRRRITSASMMQAFIIEMKMARNWGSNMSSGRLGEAELS